MRRLLKLTGLTGLLAVLTLSGLPTFAPCGCQGSLPLMRIVKADVADLAQGLDLVLGHPVLAHPSE